VGGTLSIAHDGSYMLEDAAGICSSGVIIYCRATKNWLKVLVAEHSNNASNYRGELLGAVLSLLILRAATVNLVAPYSHAKLSCGNPGVISHSNSPPFSLSEKQKQADLIQLIKHLSCTNKCQSTWEWVEGHAME
jgi:ribonuclease HI